MRTLVALELAVRGADAARVAASGRGIEPELRHRLHARTLVYDGAAYARAK